MSSAVWEGLPVDLTLSHRLTAIELPGHGYSPCEPAGGGLGDWASACLAVAPEQAAWLGWSLGGLVAMTAVLQRPERISALVLMTATPRFVQAEDWPAAMAGETLAGFHAGLLEDPAGTLQRFLALQVRGSDAGRETLRRLRRELSSRPQPCAEALASGLDLLGRSDLRDRLADLACPSLWLFGDRDTLVPAAAAEGVRRLLPGGRLGVIRGASHAPFLSHPSETAAEILSFLRELAQ
jgi:pimeloyl-[acyl-carrier protein] methyl ester esterase